jgi:hypothetical protein
MSILPYQIGCPHCDSAKNWHAKMNDDINEIARLSPGRDIVIGITINAEDVPTCREHLESDD